jgi:hypothetical protein
VSPKQAYFYEVLQKRRQIGKSLPDSFAQALEICRLDQVQHNESKDLLGICYACLEWVEADGIQKAKNNQEPAYHNRQHFADICVALAIFLGDAHSISEREKLLLLLAALTHDFGHKGLTHLPTHGTQEEETVNLVLQGPASKLALNDQNFLQELILGTTPANLDKINQRYLLDPGNKSYFMQSLLNDADIATSFIEPLTPVLSKLILIELGNPKPNRKLIEEMMSTFKTHYKLTTPIARVYLDQH